METSIDFINFMLKYVKFKRNYLKKGEKSD